MDLNSIKIYESLNFYSAEHQRQYRLRIPSNHKNKTSLTVFKSRQEHLRTACMKEGYTPPTTLAESNILGRSVIEIQHNILYCPIEKVGSTFWKKTLTAINSQGKFNSPYVVKNSAATKVSLYQEFRNKTPQIYQDQVLQNAVSLIVVRDPYTKLFSGYVDKIYHPNFLFWEWTGAKINSYIRNKSASSDIVCANHVTFSHFIKYINFMITNDQEHALNSHFTSMHSHCNPCGVKYDYISKIETFKDDVYHITDDWNERFNTRIVFDDFEKGAAKMMAKIRIKLSFKTMSKLSRRCNMPKYRFLLRTWQFLQISGLIPKNIKMPFPDFRPIEAITKDSFYAAVVEAIDDVTDWNAVKKQRREALVQAYHSVSDKDLSTLRNIVKKDCEYFNYDKRPSYLFNKNGSSNDLKYFDWL